jgi:hypothetical protein
MGSAQYRTWSNAKRTIDTQTKIGNAHSAT